MAARVRALEPLEWRPALQALQEQNLAALLMALFLRVGGLGSDQCVAVSCSRVIRDGGEDGLHPQASIVLDQASCRLVKGQVARQVCAAKVLAP